MIEKFSLVDISLIFSRRLKMYLPCASDYFMSLTATLTCSFPAFVLLGACVRSTLHYRTISGLQNPSLILRLFKTLLSSCLLCTNTGDFNPYALFLVTHLPCLPHIPRQGIVVNLHTLQALRLMATVSCPSIFAYSALCFPPTRVAALRFASLRILPNYFTVTVGTQASDLGTPYLQRRIFPIRGHLILLNMLFGSSFVFRFHSKYEWIYTYDGSPVDLQMLRSEA